MPSSALSATVPSTAMDEAVEMGGEDSDVLCLAQQKKCFVVLLLQNRHLVSFLTNYLVGTRDLVYCSFLLEEQCFYSLTVMGIPILWIHILTETVEQNGLIE